MKDKKKSDLSVLLGYAGNYKGLTFLGLALSGIAMILGMLPYICIWLVARDLIAVAPNWARATEIGKYGWMAFGFALAGIIVYFAALMCTHLAAFRTASNIRKQGMEHLMKTPLGFFDSNASGLLKNRLDGAASETETLLAHNLADIVGSATMFIGMIVLMFLFDWRMGTACLLAAVISVAAMFTMMGGKNAKLMQEYQGAQDYMSKAGTEYVRGIPVVKVFQQTVYSFKAFKEAIEDYSSKAEKYTVGVCQVPQSLNLTATEGAFIFMIPVAVFIAPGALQSGDFAGFVTNFAFYAVFSAIVSTALARIMFAASGMMLASTALGRIAHIMNAPILEVTDSPKEPKDNSIEFKDASFTYDGADIPAIDHVTFRVEPGQTVALVGPSGGGKTTAASLIPRFWDVTDGTVSVGGVDVREADPHVLMDRIAFVFQNNRLFKASIFENVRAARPDATRDEVQKALSAAQCDDILAKLPDGMDTVIGTEGTYLSGGEQQRVALARAILKDAPIVVLDEATAFADPENEALIQKAFATLTKGRTVIMIAHRLSTVVGADKIIVLNNGRVEEEGTHDELKQKNGMYSRMWADYNQAIKWRISAGEVR
ncbi:MAG: ABC transporter ATP-binding protein/permease [Lachnospiraceae bacterium]|nr:ABC transporter ATP-binding protein/permease [Lachnospiraceae bacterium]